MQTHLFGDKIALVTGVISGLTDTIKRRHIPGGHIRLTAPREICVLFAAAFQLNMKERKMSDFLFFLITVVVALVGGYIGYRLKIPAGAMVGAMVTTVAFNLITERAFFYDDLKIVMQILGGAMIGSRIGKKDVLELKNIILPTIILIISMVILNLSFGIVMYLVSDLDIATCLFASAPGGMSDMAIISVDLGANPAYVAIMQLLRILTIFIFMPPIFKKIILGSRAKQAAAKAEAAPVIDKESVRASEATGLDDEPVSTQPEPKKQATDWRRLGLLLLLAGLGGILFWYLGVTAGAMIGAMLATAVYCVLRGTVAFPTKLRFAMQVCAGAYTGIRLDRASVAQMGSLVVPMIVMIIGIFVFVFAVAFIMHKVTKLDIDVCLMSSTPGGVQEMAYLSEDLGSDTPKIAIMQTVRLFSVILFFPTMLSFITGLFN